MNAPDLPAPLVPPDVDLTDFQFMPLDVLRLRDSDMAAEETPEACWAAVLIWCASWHQVPAGSIPDSEQWQAKQAGYVARGRIDKAWADVRAGALRNWVLCSDGRLYHHVVAEKALAAWKEKLAQRARTKAATEAREAKRRAQQGQRDDVRDEQRDDVGGSTSRATSRSKNESKGQGQGQGQGQDEVNPLSEPPPKPAATRSARAPKPAAPKPDQPVGATTWNAYATAYTDRYGAPPVRNAKVNAQIAQLVQRLGLEEAPRVAAWYVGHQRQDYIRATHTVDLLLRDAEGLRTQWANGRQTTHTAASQADRTQTNASAFAPLIEEARAREAQEAAVARPDDVTETVWADFCRLRNAKKAPLTTTALAGIRREAEKAGRSMLEVLEQCCERGWTGFEADWVTQPQRNAPLNRQEALEERNRAVAKKWAADRAALDQPQNEA